MWWFINDFLTENELFAQFVLLSGLKIYFFWQKYTSQTKYFFGSLSNRSPCVRYCSYHADMQTLFDVVSKQLDFQFQYQFCLPLTFPFTLTEANVDQEFSGETFLSNTATKHPSMHLHTIQSHSLLHVRQYILMN